MNATRVDAHLHIWPKSDAPKLDGRPELKPLHRAFLPRDVDRDLEVCEVQVGILVEARRTPSHTRFMLRAARETPWVLGIVAGVTLREPAILEAELRTSEAHVCGVRESILDGSIDWLLEGCVQPSLTILADRGLALDLIAQGARALHIAARLADRHPRLSIVVDHLGSPVPGRALPEWRRAIEVLSSYPNVYFKWSGLSGTIDFLGEVLEIVLEAAGDRRLIFGSDWPVVLLRGGYQTWWQTTQTLLAERDPDVRERVLGGNAIEAYRLHSRIPLSS